MPSVPLFRLPNGQIYIKVKAPEAVNGELKFIVDTGSAPLIIRAEALDGLTPCFDENFVNLRGVSGSLRTLGSAIASLSLGRKTVPIEFQVIENFPSEGIDGLVGSNLTGFGVIDSSNMKFHYIEGPSKPNSALLAFNIVRRAIKGDVNELSADPPPQLSDIHDAIGLNGEFPYIPGTKLSIPTSRMKEETDEMDGEIKRWMDEIETPTAKTFMITRECFAGNGVQESEPQSRIEQIFAAFKHEHMSNEARERFKSLF